MAAMEEFTTLMASQGPAWMTGPEAMVNEGVLNTYTYSHLKAGKASEEMVQGGTDIRDTIYFDVQSTFQRIDMNHEFAYTNKQTGTTWAVPWAIAGAHISWDEDEEDLQVDKFQGSYRAQVYKRVMRQKHQNLRTDICNALDAEFWAPPDVSLMEPVGTPTSPRVPYSLPAFVNEFSDARPAAGAVVTGHYPGWSTVMQIDPGTQTKWQNQRGTYTFSDGAGTPGIPTAAAHAAPLFVGLSKLYQECSFERLPKWVEYSDETTHPYWIATQLQGSLNYEHGLRISQDLFAGMGRVGGSDPAYPSPMFRGIPVQWIEALDTAAIYPTGTAGALSTWNDGTFGGGTVDTVTGVGFTGPRYYLLNGVYLNCPIHSSANYRLSKPIQPSNRPFTRVQVFKLRNNVVCRSRRRQGYLMPSADTLDVAA